MNYIVFDMEWNQPYSKASAIQSPIYLAGEIIQIGAVKLDEQLQATDCLDLLIAPTFYRKLHPRIKRMTGISQTALKNQPKFKAAIAAFQEWCGEDCILLSWGYDDIQILKDNLLMHDLDEDWLPPCLNLQGIYNHQISHENRQFSLEAAMTRLGVEPTLRAHNAFDDAIYTAQVVRCLDMKEGVRNYQELNGLLWHSMHSTKETFSPFRSREKALADPRLRQLQCPICGESLRVDSFTPIDEKNAEAQLDTRHAPLLIRLKAQQTPSKQWHVRRTVRFL